MSIERQLQVFTATLAALGTLLLGMGQREVMLPLVVMIAAMASVWLTDVTAMFRLNRVVATVLGVIVSLVVFREAMPLGNIDSVLSIARLLVYLQIILLFLRKDVRIYWQLFAMSLFQVVVATVFNQGVVFGLLMAVYLFIALMTLALLFLYREARRYMDESTPARSQTSAVRRWPLADARPAFTSDGRTQRRRYAAGGELFGRVAMMGVGTLLLTGVAFFTLPRFGQPAWRSVSGPARQLVGYSGEVELGELGSVIEDPEEVMRVEFSDPATGAAYPVADAVYLQGTILTHYEKSHWSGPGDRRRHAPLMPAASPPEGEIVWQRITIEPMNRRELFAVRPFFVTEPQSDIEIAPEQERLLRDRSWSDSRFTYALGTTAFHDGRQTVFVPCDAAPNRLALAELPTGAVPSLVALASLWMADPGIAGADRLSRARRLESRLRDSGQFSYSLAPQSREQQLDPIEDFVAHHPQGHCEYFATALALMLRSQGIPSRIVVGYKCDEFNQLGGFFQVRQLHAHTWVEAYLAPDNLPGDLNGPEWRRGAWLRLDATPGGADSPQAGASSWLAPVAAGFGWLESLWDNYIMEMDRSRQYRAIYEPLVRWVNTIYHDLTDPAWWKELGAGVLRAVNPRNWNISQWFNWRGGLMGVVVCLLLFVGFRVGRRLFHAGHRRLRPGSIAGSAGEQIEVDFHRRLGDLLARHGLRRRPGETQREFAQFAGSRLAQRLGKPALAPLPGEIVDAFYQVRFGRLPLDNPGRQAVEQALARLDELSVVSSGGTL
jgi:protein-glutamine gamma-glutamyltransferase